MLNTLAELIKSLFTMTRSSRLMAVLTAYVAVIVATRIDFRAVYALFQATIAAWNKDRAAALAAGLAYYAIFSLAPALIIIIAIAGLVFEQGAVQQQIVEQVEATLGEEAAGVVVTMIENLREQQQRSSVIATVVGVVTVVFGAIGVFAHLQSSLNHIWGIEPAAQSGLRSVLFFVRRSALSFAVVAAAGFLLVLFVIINNVLTVLRGFLEGVAPEVGSVLPSTSLFVTFVALTVSFAVVLRVLPDVNVRWRDVLPGAVLTAVFFLIGQFFIGLYLGSSSVGSIYGAAGSIIVLLVWVYYSAQIFMLGAEFTKVYTRTYGSHRRPSGKGKPRAAKSPRGDKG